MVFLGTLRLKTWDAFLVPLQVCNTYEVEVMGVVFDLELANQKDWNWFGLK